MLNISNLDSNPWVNQLKLFTSLYFSWVRLNQDFATILIPLLVTFFFAKIK